MIFLSQINGPSGFSGEGRLSGGPKTLREEYSSSLCGSHPGEGGKRNMLRNRRGKVILPIHKCLLARVVKVVLVLRKK